MIVPHNVSKLIEVKFTLISITPTHSSWFHALLHNHAYDESLRLEHLHVSTACIH